MRLIKTIAKEKALTSVLNLITASLMALPLWLLLSPSLFEAKIILIWMFFLHNMIPLFFKEKRDIGMVVMRTYWEKDYSVWRLFFYSVFYTLSFVTLCFWVWFPFDLFLVNILFLQLPTILLTGTTFHGYLAGNVATVKELKK